MSAAQKEYLRAKGCLLGFILDAARVDVPDFHALRMAAMDLENARAALGLP
jgi:hypothetical protein